VESKTYFTDGSNSARNEDGLALLGLTDLPETVPAVGKGRKGSNRETSKQQMMKKEKGRRKRRKVAVDAVITEGTSEGFGERRKERGKEGKDTRLEERDVLLSDLVLFILRLENLTNTEVGNRLVQLEGGNVALLAGIAHASSLVRVEGERDRLDEDGAGVDGSVEVNLVLNELDVYRGAGKAEVRACGSEGVRRARERIETADEPVND
jgi:hypothetical protein